jgi:hypothetical protein
VLRVHLIQPNLIKIVSPDNLISKKNYLLADKGGSNRFKNNDAVIQITLEGQTISLLLVYAVLLNSTIKKRLFFNSEKRLKTNTLLSCTRFMPLMQFEYKRLHFVKNMKFFK